MPSTWRAVDRGGQPPAWRCQDRGLYCRKAARGALRAWLGGQIRPGGGRRGRYLSAPVADLRMGRGGGTRARYGCRRQDHGFKRRSAAFWRRSKGLHRSGVHRLGRSERGVLKHPVARTGEATPGISGDNRMYSIGWHRPRISRSLSSGARSRDPSAHPGCGSSPTTALIPVRALASARWRLSGNAQGWR